MNQKVCEDDANAYGISNRAYIDSKDSCHATLLYALANASLLAFLIIDDRTEEVLYFNHRFCELWNLQDIEQDIRSGSIKKQHLVQHCQSLITCPASFEESRNTPDYSLPRNTTDNELKLIDGRTIRRISSLLDISSHDLCVRIYIYEDITDRKRAEEALARAKEEAEAASYAESEFLANLSHEIRTPLNAIVGFTDLLLSCEMMEEQADFIQSIRTSSDALLSLVNDVLDLTAIDEGKLVIQPSCFSLRQLIDELIRMYQPSAHTKGLLIAAAVAPDIEDHLYGDANRIRQVLLNLVGNAIKYTTSGEVLVTVRLEPSDLTSLNLHFAVKDTGDGISDEEQHRVFDRFIRIGSSIGHVSGTGLGLPICARLVKLMGGDIWVKSKLGYGSTFHFTIPLETPKPETSSELESICKTPAEAKHSIGKSLNILVAEDNELNRKVTSYMLTRQGQSVTPAGCGDEVIELWKQGKFDLILMDVLMPGRNGYEATAVIRKREIVRLIATGISSKAVADELCVSIGTVKTHRLRIFRKLGIHTVAELTSYAIEHRLTSRAKSSKVQPISLN